MRTGASWGVVEPTRSSSSGTWIVVLLLVGALAVGALVVVLRARRRPARSVHQPSGGEPGRPLPSPPLPSPVVVASAGSGGAATGSRHPRDGDVQDRAEPRGPAVFLCYRRADSADVAGRVYQQLEARFGRERLFKDVDAIALGRDFREAIAEAMSTSAVLLAIIGPDWLTETSTPGVRRIDDPRDHVRAEVEAALARNIPVIPVLVRGALVPDEQELPASLGALAFRNGIEVRADPDFYHDMDRLMRAIATYLGI